MSYPELHARSLADPDAFWRAEARRIEWHRPFETVCDQSVSYKHLTLPTILRV